MQEPTVYDYPLIRKRTACPLCHGDKPTGNLVCWPCFRKHDLRNGESPEITERLELHETLLEYDYGRNFD